MAIVTKISSQKKAARYNIFLDGQYAFSASERTIANFVLLKGSELSEEKINEIKQFDQDAKASDLAARYLSYEIRSIKEVTQYLQKYEISSEAIEHAIGELIDLGYLDDEQYAKLFIKNDLAIGTDGPNTIANKLSRKGVDQEIISNTLFEIGEDDWLEVAKRLIKSMRSKLGKLSSREIKQKVQIKLMSHGFNANMAEQIILSLELIPDEEEQLDALKKQGIKAYKKFKRYDESQRKFKMKQYLFSHGFSLDEIECFLNGEIIELDELSEY